MEAVVLGGSVPVLFPLAMERMGVVGVSAGEDVLGAEFQQGAAPLPTVLGQSCAALASAKRDATLYSSMWVDARI